MLLRALLFLFLLPWCARADSAQEWQIALPGTTYTFPRDNGIHPRFKTEWWYFTGNLHAADGREFGYQLTWFRQGLLPERDPAASRFLVRDFKFAHFAITDIASGKFYFSQKVARGAFGEAGFGDGSPGRLAWIDDWRLAVQPDGSWHITAASEGRALDLHLVSQKSPVIEGEEGISQKAAGAGHASCYYSLTRLKTTGRLVLPSGPSLPVTGETWFDHEWATNQLAPGQAGWNWFSLQLADGTELMLYQMRLRSGAIDAASSGTFVQADGGTQHLAAADYHLTPLDWWRSPATGANYPLRWRLEIPRLKLTAEISTPVQAQELALPSLSYWEGLIHTTARRAGTSVEGHGYMELTGYGAPLTALQPDNVVKP